jgi:hypothetical protein
MTSIKPQLARIDANVALLLTLNTPYYPLVEVIFMIVGYKAFPTADLIALAGRDELSIAGATDAWKHGRLLAKLVQRGS